MLTNSNVKHLRLLMYKFGLTVLMLLIFQSAFTQCWIKIATGSNWAHSLALKNDGTLWAWGDNDYGQLGDGTLTNRFSPTQIGSDTDWMEISAGQTFSIALKQNGTLWTWGRNDEGELGDGSNIMKTTPIQIGIDTDWVMVKGGGHFSIGLKSNGTLWAWGSNYIGLLGDGTTIDKNIPTLIGSDTNWVFVDAGGSHSLAIMKDGTLWGWGTNQHGEIGDGTSNNYRLSPVQIGSDTNWVYACSGGVNSFAIKKDGTLWGWGDNLYGQVGDSTHIQRNDPIQIGKNSTNWKKVSSGYSHALALQNNGTLWAWGKNYLGMLGDGTAIDKITPIQIGYDTQWKDIAAADLNSLGLKNYHRIFSWGYNAFGQLGNGTAIPKYVPSNINNQGCPPCNPEYSSDSQSVCYGNIVNGHTHSGIYLDTLYNSLGCDSIVTLNLIVHPKSDTMLNITICSGETFLGYNSSGIYTDKFVNIKGCDSIRTIHLNVSPVDSTFLSQSICQGQEYLNYKEDGVYTDYFKNNKGCDSVRILNLIVKPISVEYERKSICPNETYLGYNNVGFYIDSFKNIFGCDSVRFIYLDYLNDNCCIVKFPNSFTPNYDGVNDCFHAISNELFQEFDFKIYNRWGQEVYHSNDQNNCWEGFFNNERVAMDTYFYILKYKCMNHSKSEIKGDVILLR